MSNKSSYRAIAALDVDDTIIHSNYPGIRGLQKDAKESIQKLYDNGVYIIIWTCRMGEPLDLAVNFLKQQGVPFHIVNDNNPELCEYYGNNTRKVAADFYVDDKDWLIQTTSLIESYPNWSRITSNILLTIDKPEFVSILNKHKDLQK